MDKRLIFGDDVGGYEKWRPQYCEDLFNIIRQTAVIGPKSYVLEIGCGTGQATKSLLEMGCQLTAIDCSEKMIGFMNDKFGQNPNLHTYTQAFEDFVSEPDYFDLVFSATAFHWIKQPEGNQQIMRCLKSGGKLAVFWNRPFVNKSDNQMHQAIQSVYSKYREDSLSPKEYDHERFQTIQQSLLASGFVDLKFYLFENTRYFIANEYIQLLNTYSDHRAMKEAERLKFEDEIASIINAFGGTLTIYDIMDLYIVQKP